MSFSRPLARYFSAAGKALTYDEVVKIRKEKLSPVYLAYYKKPLYIRKGSMQYLWDSDDRKYLDLFGGIVTVSVGHCHPKVNDATIKQLQTLWHTTGIYMTEPMHEYAAKLTSKLPKQLKVCFFTNSGSEANDLALTMARLHTRNIDIVSLRNAYHGMTSLVMGTTNHGTWRHTVPHVGMVQTMNPDPYRGPWGGSKCRDSPVQTDRTCACQPGTCQAGDNYVAQLDDVLNHCTPKKGVAAFIAESIQGVGGTVQYPKTFLTKAYELVRARGGVCIADEVQTGFGRTGEHFWGFEMHGVSPDIVTMAKGMGNGFPLGAVVTTPEIAESLSKALYFNTFGGNPVASAVGSAVLDVIDEEGLQKNSYDVGTYFLKRLAELSSVSDIIGDVRGKGLMIGVELVENKTTRKPLPVERVANIFENLKNEGVLVGKGGLHGNVFRIKPPMCITKENVDTAIEALMKSL